MKGRWCLRGKRVVDTWTDGSILLKRPPSPHWETPDTLTNKRDFSPVLFCPPNTPLTHHFPHNEKKRLCCAHKYITPPRNAYKLKEMVRNGKQRPRKLSQSQGKNSSISDLWSPFLWPGRESWWLLLVWPRWGKVTSVLTWCITSINSFLKSLWSQSLVSNLPQRDVPLGNDALILSKVGCCCHVCEKLPRQVVSPFSDYLKWLQNTQMRWPITHTTVYNIQYWNNYSCVRGLVITF